jgi:phage tail sheath protein FI
LVVATTVPPTTFIDAAPLVASGTVTPPTTGSSGIGGDGVGLQPGDYDAGFTALTRADVVNIVCIPPDTRIAGDTSWSDTNQAVFTSALNNFCVPHRAMLIVDPLSTWTTVAQVVSGFNTAFPGIVGNAARNAVTYFPRVLEADVLLANTTVTAVSSGIVAGIMAATDASRGVWKAPAGIDAGIAGTLGLALNMTDQENGEINPIGINALRTFPVIGSVVWGARTLRGADVLADDYKYLPVRRFALFLEESLVRGLKFAVFEPNDEPLWAQIRLAVGAFLNNLFRQGAFQGRTPADAYFVKADNETTTQNDINLGIVNVLVGFAPLKPAEFVIIKLQQIAGQINT